LGGSLSAGLLDFGGSEEDGVFEQAAKFFFADVMVGALAGGEILEGFVFHFQALEMNDLKVDFAFIPNLALLQFHGERGGGRKSRWLDTLFPQSGKRAKDQRFLRAACLAAMACFFFCSALLATACFWDAFFWFDFGDLSPMIFQLSVSS
jgi:hypothetical protein